MEEQLNYTKEDLIELRKDRLQGEKSHMAHKLLLDLYQKEYKPKHSNATYFKLIKDNDISEIREYHPSTDYNSDKVYQTFSVVSQHVWGYTKEHCLDLIYEAVQRKKQRIKDNKKLPTLEKLVNSGIEINPKKMYYTKEKGGGEDFGVGHSGDIILEMRRIGIKEWKDKVDKEFLDWLLPPETIKYLKHILKDSKLMKL